MAQNKKDKIIIEVRGGVVQAVYSTIPTLKIVIMDWDNEDNKSRNECKVLEKEIIEKRLSQRY